MDREGRTRESRSQRQQDILAKTSIQHLYQLLGKNMKQAHELSPLFAIDKKFQLHNHPEGIRVNLDYSQGSNEGVESPPKGILEGFHKKARKFCSHKKKAYSVEVSNNKLKDIILGKKQQKKAIFFNSIQSQPHKNIPLQKIEPNSANNKTESNQIIKRFETDCQIRAEATIQIDLNNHFQKFKSALKLKPIEYYIKKTKNSKFSIMGLSAKRHQKVKSKQCTLFKEGSLQAIELAVVNKQSEGKIVSQWKIDSIPLKFSDPKRSFNTTNINKLKKNSMEILVTKCLPYLMISQHILLKLEDMKRFYSMVLLSFQCFPSIMQPNQLPKYHRKHVKYTYYVGNGNNRTLVAELMGKRWWWRETNQIAEANFVWTQQKLKNYQQTKSKQSENITHSISSEKIDRNKLDNTRRQLYQVQQEQKCKNLFQSFEASNKRSQADDLQSISVPSLIYNHMAGGKYLGNKKSLFRLLKTWFQQFKKKPEQLFSFIPQTYYVENSNSEGFQSFEKAFNHQENGSNLWIVKPGENSNRGKGIFLSSSLREISDAVQNRSGQGGTTIIQKYLSNLLFYNGRKFDIRAYLLCITIGRNCKYYWYEQGYLRTSSHPFSLKELSSMTHLTNDAIQSQGDQYGKFQKGNKLSYAQFQSYLQQNSFNWKMSDLRIAMKRIAKIIAATSHPIINSEKITGFQLFGMDFIVDSSFKPWLLEVNTNPCLQLSCPLLQILIPNVVENVLRLSLDPVFPPTVLPNKESQYTLPDRLTEWNKFELIFDCKQEGDQEWESTLGRAWQSSKQAKDINNAIQ